MVKQGVLLLMLVQALSCSPPPTDSDGDGYPICDDSTLGLSGDCDCDDQDSQVNPSAPEIIDGIDNNCDGLIDSTGVDGDEDDFERCLDPQEPAQSSPLDCDCDDDAPSTYPGATEHPDSADNDCDGLVDEGALDTDGDGFAPCDDTLPQSPCDCDDNDPSRHPGAIESIPEIDQDCDGQLEWVRFISKGASGLANHPVGGYYFANDGADEVQRLSVTAEPLWSIPLSSPTGADGTSATLYPDGSALIAGSSDEGALLAEISPNGSIDWTATVHSENDASPYAATLRGLVTLEGGAIAFGNSESDQDEVANAAWLVRLAPDWTKEWEGFYGGTSATRINAVASMRDLGFILAGSDTTEPYDDPVPSVAYVNPSGSQIWNQNLIYENELGIAIGVFQTTPDRFEVICSTARFEDERWASEIFEMTVQGDLVRHFRYRPGKNDFAHRVTTTSEAGYLIAGETSSSTGTALFMLKVGPDLEEQWSTEIDPDLGTTSFDVYELIETPDGGYLLRVNFIDKNNSETYVARLLVKTDSRGNSPLIESLQGWIY